MAILRRYVGSLAFWMLLAYCIGAATFGYLYAEVKDQANTNKNALLALCAFKDDLDRRIQASKAFLERNPNGLPALGLSKGDFQQSITNQQRTVMTLTPYLKDC